MQGASSQKLLMKGREPKSILLGQPPTDDTSRSLAFVALSNRGSTQARHQIQMISYSRPSNKSVPAPPPLTNGADDAAAPPPTPAPDSVQSYEVIVNENVQLLKSFRLGNGPANEWLLVVGQRLQNDTLDAAGVAGGLQLSIYNTEMKPPKVWSTMYMFVSHLI
jgi:hypothetical protein